MSFENILQKSPKDILKMKKRALVFKNNSFYNRE